MNNKSFGACVQFSTVTFCLIMFSVSMFSMQVQAQSLVSNELKLMSFNIRYGTAKDGENSWQFRRENLMETIKKFDPEILGLQEALAFQVEEILQNFPKFTIVGVGRDDGKQAGEYSCILFDKNTFKPDTSETFWFSETPTVPGSKHWGNNITRICTWAKFTNLISKKQFFLYNIHLDHQSQTSREKSTEMLGAKIKSQKESLPVIVTGDFNCGEENPAIKNMLNYGLEDSYRIKNAKSESEGTFNGFSGETNGDRIDYIFISKDIKVKSAEIIRDSYNRKFPSDHFPVTAVLLW
ncbi:MAG: endonuclease/exonuclease/phosphatase family protein [Ignavibacteria bacterium]|nr:MAG: endonuclease/exonuclease/phosphatase family protein [Ignavibacteria bacterium]KAF0161510.1 MAG: endonuclease/exonuclease/phosphatase family protein [Ignavibacteria bacterium]